MTFSGCIVPQLSDHECYVCAPPVAQPGQFSAVTTPLSRADAYRSARP